MATQLASRLELNPRMLLVEDDPDDYLLTRRMLSEMSGHALRLDWESSYEGALERVHDPEYDVCILDYRLGQHSGLDLLRAARERGLRTPVIMLTGNGGRESDMEAIRAGASDYLEKGEIDAKLLERSIRHAIARRRAEDALRESEAHHRMLLDALDGSDVGTLILDREFRVVWASRAIERYFGLPREAIIGQDKRTLVRRKARGARTGTGAFASGSPASRSPGDEVQRVECLALGGAGGRQRWLEHRSEPIRSGPYVGGWMEFFTDVTERHRIEQRLQRSEELYRQLVENASDIIYRIDLEGRFTFVNSVAVRVMGYPHEELVRKHFLDLVRPDLRDTVREFYLRQIQERIPSTYLEFVAVARDGRDVWIGQNVQLTRSGNRVEGMQAMARDISEQKWAEAALDETLRRERSARKRAETIQRREMILVQATQFLDSTFDVLGSSRDECLSELTGRITGTEVDSCSIYEDRGDALVLAAHGCRASIEPDGGDDPCGREYLDAELELARWVHVTGQPRQLTKGIGDSRSRVTLGATGGLAAVEGSALVLVPLLARGHRLGVLALGIRHYPGEDDRESLRFGEDLALRIALALDNSRLYREADRASRIRDDVLAIVSHDLTNPLSVVSLVASELLREEKRVWMNDLERRQIRILGQAAERMHTLIRDLLDVARAEAGTLPVDPVRCGTGVLMQQTVELHLPLVNEKGLSLQAVLPANLPDVLADPNRLLQALSNLLGNAIRYTPPEGGITLGARATAREVIFSVSDTGPGIADDDLPHVFDRFWQAKRTRRAGAGLGLAIVRGIAESHGGKVWAESRLGEGSTFHLAIPRAVPEAIRHAEDR